MGTSTNGTAAARRAEQERQENIRSGRSQIDRVFGEFDDDFFQQIGQASLGVNLPQVNRQFNDQSDLLLARLAEIGQLNGTTSARRFARLSGDRELALSQANSLAAAARRRARQDVESERRTLVSQLEATADPALAAASSNAALASLREEVPVEQIGTLFQNTTAGLGQVLQPRFDADTGARLPNRFSQFFANGNSGGSGSVVRR